MNSNAVICHSTSHPSSSVELPDDQPAPTLNEHYTKVLNSPPRTDQYDISRVIKFLVSNEPMSDHAFGISEVYSGFAMDICDEDSIIAAIFSGNHGPRTCCTGTEFN